MVPLAASVGLHAPTGLVHSVDVLNDQTYLVSGEVVDHAACSVLCREGFNYAGFDKEGYNK